jgi:ABC-type nitrate/sulfonate/bicarbonate transport system permease component
MIGRIDKSPSQLRIAMIRLVALAMITGIWEAAAQSGLFYRDVIPSLVAIGGALVRLVADGEFYHHFWTTLFEVGVAVSVGATLGIVIGLVIGRSRFLTRAFEPYLYYLGPTPKIVFFPIMLMWFGVGPASKVAMGAISCFFPVVLSVSAGMRQLPAVLLRVGYSFNATAWQAATKIHLPAMRAPILNGLRLGLGVAIIGTLLAETKLSNAGVGHLIMRAYSVFDMPRMYALLIVAFGFAVAVNALIGRFGLGRHEQAR